MIWRPWSLSTPAAWQRWRKQARHAGGNLLLAAPQQQVRRVLALTRLIDVFPVHAGVGEAADSAGRPRRAAGLPPGSPIFLAVT